MTTLSKFRTCQQAEPNASLCQDTSHRPGVLSGLGANHWALNGLDQAADCYLRVRQLYHAIGDAIGEGAALVDCGAIQHTRRDLSGAVELYTQALDVLQGPEPHGAPAATALMNRGVAHRDLRRPREAYADSHAALALFRAVNDRRNQAPLLDAPRRGLHQRPGPLPPGPGARPPTQRRPHPRPGTCGHRQPPRRRRPRRRRTEGLERSPPPLRTDRPPRSRRPTPAPWGLYGRAGQSPESAPVVDAESGAAQSAVVQRVTALTVSRDMEESAWTCSWVRIRLQVPSRCQRRGAEAVDGLPLAVACGNVAPGRAGPRPPAYAVDQLPLGPDRWPPRLLAHRRQRLQPGPLLARQISTPHEWIMTDLDPLMEHTLVLVLSRLAVRMAGLGRSGRGLRRGPGSRGVPDQPS